MSEKTKGQIAYEAFLRKAGANKAWEEAGEEDEPTKELTMTWDDFKLAMPRMAEAWEAAGGAVAATVARNILNRQAGGRTESVE